MNSPDARRSAVLYAAHAPWFRSWRTARIRGSSNCWMTSQESSVEQSSTMISSHDAYVWDSTDRIVSPMNLP